MPLLQSDAEEISELARELILASGTDVGRRMLLEALDGLNGDSSYTELSNQVPFIISNVIKFPSKDGIYGLIRIGKIISIQKEGKLKMVYVKRMNALIARLREDGEVGLAEDVLDGVRAAGTDVTWSELCDTYFDAEGVSQ